MKKMNVWRRTLAGLMSLLIVAGYSCPAEIGLFEGIPFGIAAHAEEQSVLLETNKQQTSYADDGGIVSVTCTNKGDRDGFWLNSSNNTATIALTETAKENYYIAKVVLVGGYETGNWTINGTQVCDGYTGSSPSQILCKPPK